MTPHFAMDAKEAAVAFDFDLKNDLQRVWKKRNHCVLVSSSHHILRSLALLLCRNACKGKDHKDFYLI